MIKGRLMDFFVLNLALARCSTRISNYRIITIVIGILYDEYDDNDDYVDAIGT